ncbi:putative hydrolase [Clostridium cavendishii DSM 21758]|uniref:Putative hydrolase n=1 Tax=Clostridium cavendishii DSM 21758 TaxID=1121302 RepID=A0A1M6NB84_9CLOT|nr:PHP domain-containing protein [Clostridium cavendishii]SHJ92961.1 putative hydrolase [Clostridium cavendishii DSM 21758]
MGFNIIADYHTHTNLGKGHIPLFNIVFGDHAKGSIESNAVAGIQKGLKEIAITDHGYRHIAFGMKSYQYREIRKLIDDLNNTLVLKENNFKILLGVECNIISKNGDIDVNDEIIEYLDIICAGYHRGTLSTSFIKKNYTEAVINAIKRYDITILNHPVEHVNPDIIEVGKVAVCRNTAFEINRSHKNMDIDTIKRLKNLGVKFSLGSDAHKSNDVGCFGEAYNIAEEAGLTNDDIINAYGSAHKSMKLLKLK